MAIQGHAEIFIEPDGQYTTITRWSDDSIEGQNLITPALNQTITAAFNKARDDLATLITGGRVVRNLTITVRID